jgi:hypothetical protein
VEVILALGVLGSEETGKIRERGANLGADKLLDDPVAN